MQRILTAMVGGSDRSNTPAVVVVVAVVGLLATVGSAALGGFWANKSVEHQFESQRSAEIQDQRREVYDDYLRAVGKLCQVLKATGEGVEADKAAFEVLNQGGRVGLIAGPALKDAVSVSTHALVFEPETGPCSANDRLERFIEAYIDAAQPDLE